ARAAVAWSRLAGHRNGRVRPRRRYGARDRRRQRPHARERGEQAEATVLLILETLYDLAAARTQLRAGWQRGGPMRSRMLKERTVGLIGFGQIAQAVAERLPGWKVDILVSAPRLHAALPPHGRRVELDELLA